MPHDFTILSASGTVFTDASIPVSDGRHVFLAQAYKMARARTMMKISPPKVAIVVILSFIFRLKTGDKCDKIPVSAVMRNRDVSPCSLT